MSAPFQCNRVVRLTFCGACKCKCPTTLLRAVQTTLCIEGVLHFRHLSGRGQALVLKLIQQQETRRCGMAANQKHAAIIEMPHVKCRMQHDGYADGDNENDGV